MSVTPFAARRKSATVTVAVMLADPDVAVIVAVPVATGLTSPAYDTVATAAADVLHVTVAPLIVAPFWSLTVAVIRVVSPKEAKLRLVAESVIDVATGVGSVGLPSPPQGGVPGTGGLTGEHCHRCAFPPILWGRRWRGIYAHKPSDYSNTSSDIDHTVGYESQPSEHR